MPTSMGVAPELLQAARAAEVPHQLRPERAHALARGGASGRPHGHELGVNAKLAKRAGLLHDLGKAVDHEVEGSHAGIGGNLARRYGESEAVAHIIEAHHNEVEPSTVEAVLVAAGDAVSGARPGARRETLETYIKRLETLERIAETKKGVEKSLRHPGRPRDPRAGQAGRDRRRHAGLLCREIAKEIEQELDYPGHDPGHGHPREPRRGVRQVERPSMAGG